MSSAATVVIDYRAQPGKGALAHAALADLIVTVVADEKDCLGITLLEDADDDTHFMLYERWTSREAYTGPHMDTAHILAFIERASGLFVGPPARAFFVQLADEKRPKG